MSVGSTSEDLDQKLLSCSFQGCGSSPRGVETKARYMTPSLEVDVDTHQRLSKTPRSAILRKDFSFLDSELAHRDFALQP